MADLHPPAVPDALQAQSSESADSRIKAERNRHPLGDRVAETILVGLQLMKDGNARALGLGLSSTETTIARAKKTHSEDPFFNALASWMYEAIMNDIEIDRNKSA